MAPKKISGLSNIIGTLIDEQPESDTKAESQQTKRAEAKANHVRKAVPAPEGNTEPRRQSARVGRPPGRTADDPVVREKVSLRVDSDVIAEYRDWSWDERCQLGELVERAMIHYMEARGRKR